MRPRLHIGLFLGACLLTQGCFAPYFDPEEPQLDPVQLEEPVEEVVVAGYYELTRTYHSEYLYSTGTHAYYQVTTTDGMKDASAALAADITAAGLKAQANAQATPADLKPGQILVRGSIDTRNDEWSPRGTAYWPQTIISCLTLLIYGGIIPYPVSVEGELGFDVVIEIYGSDGKLLSTNRQRRLLAWEERYMFLHGGMSSIYKADIREQFRPRIARAVVKALKKP